MPRLERIANLIIDGACILVAVAIVVCGILAIAEALGK